MSRVDYDALARGYADVRRPDPRIAAAIDAALGDARTVVNVGAGTGSYEPRDRDVTAVEPSAGMIAARPPGAAPALRGVAEALPFADGAFEAAMAILTIHHWPDQRAGLAELCRVARRRVVLTFDPAFIEAFWLVAEYLPGNIAIDRDQFPPIERVADALGEGDVHVVEIPHDCTDGFLCAYWRRPEAYLNSQVRAGISTFARLDPAEITRGIERLRSDLSSGAFWERHAALADRTSLDLGYRLIVAGA